MHACKYTTAKHLISHDIDTNNIDTNKGQQAFVSVTKPVNNEKEAIEAYSHIQKLAKVTKWKNNLLLLT